MEGSRKQIKWAEEIKNNMTAEFEKLTVQLKDSVPGLKALGYIQELNRATFWIDNKGATPTYLLQRLTKGTLQTWGSGFSRKAVIDQQTGQITITWSEIVDDGKGGHHEERQEII